MKKNAKQLLRDINVTPTNEGISECLGRAGNFLSKIFKGVAKI